MKNFFAILLICAISCLVFVFGVEIALRLTHGVATWQERNGHAYVSPYAVKHSSWLCIRKPNTKYSYSQPEFDFSFTTNSQGLRDIEHPIKKPENEYRVIILGDSLVEGQGVEFEKTWTRVLEKSLNKHGNQFNYRIINGGVAGSDPFFARQLFLRRLLKYDPDTVILALNSFDLTDVAARGGEERFLPDGSLKYRDPPSWEPGLQKAVCCV